MAHAHAGCGREAKATCRLYFLKRENAKEHGGPRGCAAFTVQKTVSVGVCLVPVGDNYFQRAPLLPVIHSTGENISPP